MCCAVLRDDGARGIDEERAGHRPDVLAAGGADEVSLQGGGEAALPDGWTEELGQSPAPESERTVEGLVRIADHDRFRIALAEDRVRLFVVAEKDVVRGREVVVLCASLAQVSNLLETEESALVAEEHEQLDLVGEEPAQRFRTNVPAVHRRFQDGVGNGA